MITLPEPTCPFGYTSGDLVKIFNHDPMVIAKFKKEIPHQTCDGFDTKDDRKSKLQRYATVCVDYPHGWIWSRDSILQFMKDEE